jgi:hypothetical protein
MADAVMKLVAQWRTTANDHARDAADASPGAPRWRQRKQDYADMLRACADELEAALADALPPTVGPSYAELARVAAWGVRAEVREHHCCSWTIATCSGGDDRDECAACWFAYLAQRPLPEEAPDV